MPLPIPFYLRLSQTSALTHGELDGNLSILSQKIDNTVGNNLSSNGIGLYVNKTVNPNDGALNFRTILGGGGIGVFVSGGSIMITGHTAPEIDINVTGGTYNPVDGCATFYTNSGSTFQVCGFLTGYTDSFTNESTLSGTSIVFDNTTEGPNYYNVDLWPLLSGFTTDACCYWTAGTGTNAVKLINNGGTASGNYSVAEGTGTTAAGNYSHAEGENTIASGRSSHAEGENSKAYGDYSVAINRKSLASGTGSFASGKDSIASGSYSHSIGIDTIASRHASHAEGITTVASGDSAHAEGSETVAGGDNSHAEGKSTVADGEASHAQGESTRALGSYSHAEGYGNYSIGDASHTEGGHDGSPTSNPTSATTFSSHAEGLGTLSSGIASHAEGTNTVASGNYSHAGGMGSSATTTVKAAGEASFAHFKVTETTTAGVFGEAGAILGGIDHEHAVTSTKSIIGGGSVNNISGYTENSGIIAGHNNVITSVGINPSSDSAIIGGQFNQVSAVKRSVILGGTGIDATVNNAVYVPKLNIGTPLTTTPIFNLGLDSTGFVTTATTSGSGFDWCDPYVMSGNTSGCCIDHLFVTSLSGCSPIYIGGPNRIEASGGTCVRVSYPLGSPPGIYLSGGTLGQGNVNVEGVLNIRNYNNRYPAVNVDLEPKYNPNTQYVLTWNTRPCKAVNGQGTRGDVEYVTKPKFWQYWGSPFGVIEMGTTDTNELTQRYGSTSAITIHVTSAGTAQQVFKNVEPNTKSREVKIWIPEESIPPEIGNAWFENMGIIIQAWSGATSATTKLTSKSISTTGTISADILSATTLFLDGVSFSACCAVDCYENIGTASTINWAVNLSTNYEVTLDGNGNLALGGVICGDYGTIIIHQDGIGGRTLSLGNINGSAGTHYIVNGGDGSTGPTLTSTANATDILSFTYNGTAAYWTVGNDYT